MIALQRASKMKSSEILRSRSPSSRKRSRFGSLLREENKDFRYAEAQRDFGFRPLAFEDGIGIEVEEANYVK